MWSGVDAVQAGAAQAAVAGGHAGALMAVYKLQLRTMGGLDRPAIVASWPTLRGTDITSLPAGLFSPKSVSAIARPPNSPGYHASSIAGPSFPHGIKTAEPVFSPTTVCGLAAVTASIKLFWSLDSASG